MGRAFSDITFTPEVRAVQSLMGSREQYAFLDSMADRGDALTQREADFIVAADHFFQATVSETGWPYVQHRGGPQGFLKVLGPRVIGFADYRGNVQYLSVGNLHKDDRISLIIIDYPNRRRLKILGRVKLIEASNDGDAALLNAVRDESYPATVERAFIISIEGWDWNCPQHITPRLTEAEVASLVAPLRDQIKRLRGQVAASREAAKPVVLGDGPLQLKIAGVRQLTPNVRAFELVAAGGGALPEVQAGAHLEVPVRLAVGTMTTRSYSVASSPARTDAYEIAVLREAAGAGGSMAVHEDFAIGLQLNCSMPSNGFALQEGDHRTVLIAGGIGITPLKAMAHQLLSEGRAFALHYACRSRDQAPFLGQLLEVFGTRVAVYANDEGGRLDVDALLDGLDATDQVYVCGPPKLIDAVRAAGERSGVGDNRIHFERFAAAREAEDHGFVVQLARSGRRIEVGAKQSILEAVESTGIRVASSCRVGTCATCATRVVDGTPVHRDEVLSAKQRDEQHLMCICVSRAEGGEISLDL